MGLSKYVAKVGRHASMQSWIINACLYTAISIFVQRKSRLGKIDQSSKKQLQNVHHGGKTAHIERLDAIGFAWKVELQWNTHFNDLVNYKHQHGNYIFPQKYDPNPTSGILMHRNQTECKRGNRLQEHVKKGSFLVCLFVFLPFRNSSLIYLGCLSERHWA